MSLSYTIGDIRKEINQDKIKIARINNFFKVLADKSYYLSDLRLSKKITDYKLFIEDEGISLYELIEEYFDDFIKILVKNGIYDYSIEDLKKDFLDESSFVRDVENLYIPYTQIMEKAELKKDYRKARRANRGRIVGGGFGIKGAAKGIITAGIANVGIGATHGIINSMGNAGGKLITIGEMDLLFADNQIKKCSFLISKNIYHLKDILIKLLINNNLLKTQSLPSTMVINKSSSILENLISNRLPESKVDLAIAFIIETNPFNEKIYQYIKENRADIDISDVSKIFIEKGFKYPDDDTNGDFKNKIDNIIGIEKKPNESQISNSKVQEEETTELTSNKSSLDKAFITLLLLIIPMLALSNYLPDPLVALWGISLVLITPVWVIVKIYNLLCKK